MAESYSKRIRDYCEQRGIDVPPGFGRHPASRYAAVDTGKVPPRLIAATWFKQADLLYYVQRHPAPASLRLLDFKNGQEVVLRGTSLEAAGRPLAENRVPSMSELGATGLSARTAALIDALFAPQQREAATKLVEDHCGTNLPFLAGLDPIQLERYRFAALRVSEGNLKGLESAIALAKTDWRDLLMQADFGRDTQAHDVWCADTLRAAGGAPPA